MTVRTTVAFDPATVVRLERLAARWQVSKSEAMRRALEQAENQERAEETGFVPPPVDVPDFSTMTPMEIMRWLEENPQVPPGTGDRWSRELREEREAESERYYQREREAAARALKVAEESTGFAAGEAKK